MLQWIGECVGWMIGGVGIYLSEFPVGGSNYHNC